MKFLFSKCTLLTSVNIRVYYKSSKDLFARYLTNSSMLNESSLSDLISLAKEQDLLTVEATVDTGFEQIAEQECREKLGADLCLVQSQGRVYFNADKSQYPIMQSLRSVNNLSFVVDYFTHVGFLSPGEENCEDANIKLFQQLAEKVSWEKYLDVWKNSTKFHGILYPNRREYEEACLKPGIVVKDVRGKEEKSRINRENNENTILHFRVTCYRSGKHSFGSQDAAWHFGGRLQDHFNWVVDLSNYHLEIILGIRDDDVRVLLSVTEESLHNRNLSHFGITTLRSTISYNLLQVAKPKVGDLILDPLCGSGSIPIEGASGIVGNFYLCGDNHAKSINITKLNKSKYFENYKKNLLVDPHIWDTCALPLKNSCIDVVTTDLPFGKRVGSKLNNKTLYPGLMAELARIVRPSSGRVVLLTTDRTSYNLGFQRTKIYWKQMKQMMVKIGGLKACVYLLGRTSAIFK